MFLTTPVPNKEAAALISGKSVVTREVFQQLLPELQADAFVIAGIESLDVVQRIRDNIATLPMGGDWDTIKKEIAADLGPWFDNPENAERRAELLLRLHGFRAYQACQHRLIEAHADSFPYCQYVCTMDGRQRPSHQALHGKVLPTNHPFWINHTGPWEWGCRCEKVPLTGEEADEMRGEDATGDPARARVIEGAALHRLETTGRLIAPRRDPRGGLAQGSVQEFDVRTPKERGESDFEWRAGDTGLTLDEIKGRYDPPVFAIWEAMAKRDKLPDGRTIWLAVIDKKKPRARRVVRSQPVPGLPVPVPVPVPVPGGSPAAPAPGIVPARVSPVSAAFGSVDQAVQTEVAASLANIDTVHDDGTMRLSNVSAKPGTTGGYHPPTSAIYLGDASQVKISQFTHEAGHKLDFEAIQPARKKDKAVEAAWQKVMTAIRATAAVKTLSKNPSNHVQGYLLNKFELWARAYDQFIAEESGSVAHRKEIMLRAKVGYNPHSQWSAADFIPVKDAIRALLVQLNYIPTPTP